MEKDVAAVCAEQAEVTADAQKWREKLKTQGAITKANVELNKQPREEKVPLKERKRDLDT
jgi:hypothetical protein